VHRFQTRQVFSIRRGSLSGCRRAGRAFDQRPGAAYAASVDRQASRRSPDEGTMRPRSSSDHTNGCSLDDIRSAIVTSEPLSARSIRAVAVKMPGSRISDAIECSRQRRQQQCGFSSFMSTCLPLNCDDEDVLTWCPHRKFSLSCPLVQGRELNSCQAQLAPANPSTGYRHVTAEGVYAQLGSLNLLAAMNFVFSRWTIIIGCEVFD
jgi:hypothetical protein